MQKKSKKKELELKLGSFLLEQNLSITKNIDGVKQYKEVPKSKGLEIGITYYFKKAILSDIPVSKTLNTFIEDPNSGLFKPSTLKDVFKLSKKIPFITGGQIITALVLQKLSKELIVAIDKIKDLSVPTGLHPKTVSKNLKALQRELLFAQERENGGLGFKGKILLTKQANSSNSYKLNGEFFTTEKFVSTGKGKKTRSDKVTISHSLLNLTNLIIFVSKLPYRNQDRAVIFFIYLSHMFTRRNATPTQHILLSELKGRIFSREVFYRNDINKTIKIFLDGLKNLGYVLHYEFSKNRIGKESVRITWINNLAIHEDSLDREPKNAYREPKNARGIFCPCFYWFKMGYFTLISLYILKYI